MNTLLEPFARSMRQGPVFASVILDDMLRKAGLTWQEKTENVLIGLMREASRGDGHAQHTMQVFKNAGDVDQMGSLIIDLVVAQGGAIHLASPEFGELLDLPPYWLMIGSGQPCEVAIAGRPMGGGGNGYAEQMPGMPGGMEIDPMELVMGMLLISSLVERRRQMQRRMIATLLVMEIVQIIVVLLMGALGIYYKIPALIIGPLGMYLSTWMGRGWFRRGWIAITIIATLATIIF